MNRKSAATAFLAIAMAAVFSGCSTVGPQKAGAKSADTGYFLSMKQKGQLIGKGQIQDEAGIWYDVWIIPGYVEPARKAGTSLRKTGSDFAEYFHREKYHDLAKDSKDAFHWAFNDCLTDFTVKGVPRAWGRYFDSASERTSRRVFCWWTAYPWAFLEGTVDTVVRVPIGLVGTVSGTVCGGVVVPGYYAVNSTAAGCWDFSVNTVLLPVAGCTWNTIIAPPMALTGQKPAPSRVDGFWIRQLGADEKQVATMREMPISRKDVETLAQWGRVILTATQPCEDRRQELQKQIKAEQDAIKKLKKAQSETWTEERKSIETLSSNPAQAEIVAYLREQGFDAQRISKASADVRRQLESLKTLSPAEITRILNLLATYPFATLPNPQPPRGKTDPVQNSIDVIKEIK